MEAGEAALEGISSRVEGADAKVGGRVGLRVRERIGRQAEA